MSWFFRSNPTDSVIDSDRHGGASAVKDDISLIFRGVANFLAPPPSSLSSSSSSAGGSSSSPPSPALTGIRNDLVEIGGSFKSSLTGISKLASQLLQFEHDDQQRRVQDGGDYDDDDDAVPGTTDEVVRFVKDISARPECWTGFPLPLPNDFSMSNSQREHALAIELLVPEFLTLRQNLCGYMNVEKFWMIYFLLILPRLNQHDFELLSTPKIVEARDVLLLKLEKGENLQAEEHEKPRTADTNQDVNEDSGRESISSEPNQILAEVTNAVKILEIDEISSTENWLEEKDIDVTSLASCTKPQQEEDVSFSDLDDDGSYSSDRVSCHNINKEPQEIRGSSPESSSDWIQLRESSSGRGGGGGWKKPIHSKGKDSEDESNDWLTVDEFN